MRRKKKKGILCRKIGKMKAEWKNEERNRRKQIFISGGQKSSAALA